MARIEEGASRALPSCSTGRSSLGAHGRIAGGGPQRRAGHKRPIKTLSPSRVQKQAGHAYIPGTFRETGPSSLSRPGRRAGREGAPGGRVAGREGKAGSGRWPRPAWRGRGRPAGQARARQASDQGAPDQPAEREPEEARPLSPPLWFLPATTATPGAASGPPGQRRRQTQAKAERQSSRDSTTFLSRLAPHV